ncbi:MAG: RNA-directed DNA polymerase [Eubacteriales bacterium]|nr:RNA-directed DNA polymerase [Eubacteriales bacterium]
MVDENPEYYLKQIQDMLVNHTYQTSKYEVFIKKDGIKEREIYKLPYFPDRICQWAIMQVIEPILLNNLTIDTYSAIPDRGIHFGLNRVIRDMRTDVKGCQYCLKLDARKYYPSIDHHILKLKYRKIFKDKDLLWLLDEIIDSTEGGTGIPIGNYLSQWSGNFYLSSFDHWIKEVKGVKHYHRYMDDIVIFGESKDDLHILLKEIKEFFHDELKLKVKDNHQVFPTYIRGVDFLGYRIFMDYVLLRKTTCVQMKKKMTAIRKKVQSGNLMNYSEWCSVNSYKGWLIYCNSAKLQKKYIEPLIPHAVRYYENIIKKGLRNNERLWDTAKCCYA